MGWGEIVLSLVGFGFLAAGAAVFGEWLICGLDEIGARFRIRPRERTEAEGAAAEGEPPTGSPAWVRRMRENEE